MKLSWKIIEKFNFLVKLYTRVPLAENAVYLSRAYLKETEIMPLSLDLRRMGILQPFSKFYRNVLENESE
jgi:hypothetical protein